MHQLSVALLLAISLSGCLVDGNANPLVDDEDRDVHMSESGTCTVNGQPCDARMEPTGPREAVDVDETGDATGGYDETFTWSVWPNATRASLKVVVAGPADTGAETGAIHYELYGPGISRKQGDCDSGPTNNSFVVSGQPRTLVDTDPMAEGDWSFRLCMDPSASEYDIQIHVAY